MAAWHIGIIHRQHHQSAGQHSIMFPCFHALAVYNEVHCSAPMGQPGPEGRWARQLLFCLHSFLDLTLQATSTLPTHMETEVKKQDLCLGQFSEKHTYESQVFSIWQLKHLFHNKYNLFRAINMGQFAVQVIALYSFHVHMAWQWTELIPTQFSFRPCGR
jgi:hypothetical protein